MTIKWQKIEGVDSNWRRLTIEGPFPRDPDVLQKLVFELADKVNALVDRGILLEARLERELQRRYGRKSENVDPRQKRLFEFPEESDPTAADQAEGEQGEDSKPLDRPCSPNPKRPKKRNGRRPLPDNLPRIEKRLDLDPEERVCSCCNQPMVEIGQEITEQLEHVPSRFFALRFIRPKYACKKCEDGVLTAPPPAAPITKGLAGPGVLAHIVTGKYCDHLPLHRQEAIFARHDIDLSRSTMADWIAGAARLLEPLYEQLKAQVLSGRRVHLDDTPVNVQRSDGKKRGKARNWQLGRGYMWAYVGDDEHPFVVYDYTRSRSRRGPLEFLRDFRGYVQADDYRAHAALFRDGTRKHVACWAHARRKFYNADSTDRTRARYAIKMIRKLYDLEREIRGLTDAERLAARQERAQPVLEALYGWLQEQRRWVLPKSPIGKAISYTLALWPELQSYSRHGFLEIDNNAAERAIKPLVIGRKNWLFAGSDRGARHGAILFSVISSCKLHGKDPYAYLRDLFEFLPTYRGDPAELLPDRYKPKPPPNPFED